MPKIFSSIQKTVDTYHFKAVSSIVEKCKSLSMPALGALSGLFLYEGFCLFKVAWTSFSYRKKPSAYGFCETSKENTNLSQNKKPLLIIHGALGDWRYLGPLAEEMKKTHHVFVTTVPMSASDEEKTQFVKDEIEKIYSKTQQKVDLLCHSQGSYIGYTALFENETTENNHVNKAVFTAYPLQKEEGDKLRSIGKAKDVFCILAERDELFSQAQPDTKLSFITLDAAHVDIVYHPELGKKALSHLDPNILMRDE